MHLCVEGRKQCRLTVSYLLVVMFRWMAIGWNAKVFRTDSRIGKRMLHWEQQLHTTSRSFQFLSSWLPRYDDQSDLIFKIRLSIRLIICLIICLVICLINGLIISLIICLGGGWYTVMLWLAGLSIDRLGKIPLQGKKFSVRFLPHLHPWPTQLYVHNGPTLSVGGKMRRQRRGLTTRLHVPRLRKWSR